MPVREAKEKTKFWHAGDLGNLELLRATYITHSFSPHIHEGFAIGVIEKVLRLF
ncbi:MAG: AraC family ligand binding domain-containing protein [Bacillota bacterium]